jgi:hypothetical protein
MVLLTCVFMRPELTNVVLGAYDNIRRFLAPELDLRLLAVGSEGMESRRLCERHGFDYVEFPNTPLSHKWNAGVRAAQEYDPDGLVIVGSDDLMSAGVFPAYGQKLQNGLDLFGLTDLYFFDAASGRLGYWAGYGKAPDGGDGDPIGCGLCFSRALLERTDWRLWPEEPGYDSLLDGAALRFLEGHGFSPVSLTMEELGIRAVDIKVGPNITPFDRYDYQDSWSGNSFREFLGEWLSEDDLLKLAESAQPGGS